MSCAMILVHLDAGIKSVPCLNPEIFLARDPDEVDNLACFRKTEPRTRMTALNKVLLAVSSATVVLSGEMTYYDVVSGRGNN